MERKEWSQEDWVKENKRKGGCAKFFIWVCLLLILALVGLAVINYMDVPSFLNRGDSGSREPEGAPPQPVQPESPITPLPYRNPDTPIRPDVNGSNLMTTDTVKNIVELCGDAVVRIATEVTRSYSGSPFFDPFFREFFDSQPPQTETGLGSGFLFREDGYILTNNHVVEGAETINVYLSSNENPFTASVIGRAPELDLAVIKIEGEGFPYLYLGDSDQVSVGDWVVAIGNPYGLDHTVTVGVISAKGRPLTIEGTVYQNLLQTDAAINRGNSGGPLLSLTGEVIGINTAINASAQGIGFAIPSSTVLDVLAELESGIERIRPWIGIVMNPMSRDMLQYFNIEGIETGVIVYSVEPGAPADKAGIRRGDVLLEVDGQTITDMSQVRGIILSHKVGDMVMIKVFRDGEELDIMVELEASQAQE
ncbi:MAG: trypsin-like peptidase domain-containing protein [Clostridiales bacterium]|nr:trypsin-like peptidase domain-containing protein [Clostridiales bacterium]